MDLLIIRHAIAEDPRIDLPDSARALTEDGKKKFFRCARGLESLDLRLHRILHSPLLRAVQTAELLSPLLRPDGETAVCHELAEPPGPALLGKLDFACVSVVGHEPWMGELVAWLLTGRKDMGPSFPMKRGGVAWLEGEPRPGGMSMKALLPPSVLRGL